MSKLSATIDRVIESLKWPVAWLSVIGFPLLFWGFLVLAYRSLSSPWTIIILSATAGGFIFSWRSWLGTTGVTRWILTVEHELTHALAAWATGHQVVGFRASVRRGGHVKFVGKGNWLITSAPYFFPTAAIILLLISYLMPLPFLPWSTALLGVALGYHIMSTWHETHGDQSDLKILGRTFCWMFLPTANLITICFIIAFALDGFSGIGQYLTDSWQPVNALGSTIYSSLFQQAEPLELELK